MYKIVILSFKKDIDEHAKNNTSLPESFNIEPIAVRNKIFGSGFLGAVVQLTYALVDDVVKALTSDVIVALVQTVKPDFGLLLEEGMSF